MAATFNTPNGPAEAVPISHCRWRVLTKPGGTVLGEIERDLDRFGAFLAFPPGEVFHVCVDLKSAVQFLGGKPA